jgi:hypothetical protein
MLNQLDGISSKVACTQPARPNNFSGGVNSLFCFLIIAAINVVTDNATPGFTPDK